MAEQLENAKDNQSGKQSDSAEPLRNELNSTQTGSENGKQLDSIRYGSADATQHLPTLDLIQSPQGSDQSKLATGTPDKTQENKEPWQIARDLVEAVKNGAPLDNVQKEIGQYMQRMMSAGLSDFEIRKNIGNLSNELRAGNTGLTDSNGNPMDLSVRLSGDSQNGFTVHVLSNELTKNEKELSRFNVSHDGSAQNPNDQNQENKEPWQISKDLAEAIRNGQSLEQAQKDLTAYIQKLMNSGMSEFEMRKWVGQLNDGLSARNTGLVDANGKPMNINIMLSGDGRESFKVHIIQNALQKSEQELHTFEVRRR